MDSKDEGGLQKPKGADMTQHEVLLAAFKRGECLTVAESLSRYGIYALSQRCGELVEAGHPIKSHTIKTVGGKKVSLYYWGEPIDLPLDL